MTAPTVAVTVRLQPNSTQPMVGVIVRAKLDKTEIYNGFVVTDEVTGVTDSTGKAILQLFPNAPSPSGLGTQGTTWKVTATVPGARNLSVTARIPNAACNLEDCIVEDESVPLSASQLAAVGAQNSAAAAATQAGIATAAATAASTSASNAATSASNAATSASNAATSEANAAASYDSFDDRYLGSKTSDPTLDNDGNALLVGALYFNSSTGQMKVRTAGAVWAVITIASSAYIATLLDDVDAATARTTLGAGATGSTLFTAATAAAGRTTLGSGATGDSLFTAATAAAGRTTLGSGATGDSLFTAATAAAGRTTLGSGATGDSLFTAATAAAARTTLATASTGEIQAQTFVAFTSAGTSTAYTLTPTPAIAAYAAGQSFFVNFHAASGASPTISVSGLAAVNLLKEAEDGSYVAVEAGDITLNHRSRCTMLDASNMLVERLPAPRAAPLGQCRLTKSGANLLLSPFMGNMLFINGANRKIPSAGVTLAVGAAVANTLYYIYAFMSGATMTLEFSTTAHATDATWGHEVKSGDSTRTLVGMARPIAGPAWQDTIAQRFVVSFFNRRDIPCMSTSVSVTGITTTNAERTPSNRCEFLTWADEAVYACSFGEASDSTVAANLVFISTGVDGASGSSMEVIATIRVANDNIPTSCQLENYFAEGYHFSTLFGRVNSGTTGAGTFTNVARVRG